MLLYMVVTDASSGFDLPVSVRVSVTLTGYYGISGKLPACQDHTLGPFTGTWLE